MNLPNVKTIIYYCLLKCNHLFIDKKYCLTYYLFDKLINKIILVVRYMNMVYALYSVIGILINIKLHIW